MFTPRISARVQAIKISATKEMPMIAAKVGGCVSLGQGVPSFPTPPQVAASLMRELADNPSAGKYSLQPGLTDLRRACADLVTREKGVALDPETEVGITVGAMEALFCAVSTLVDRGDEVLVPEPFYPSHVEQILMSEGRPVLTPLRRSDWGLDVSAMRRAVTPRTRAMLISSPHNPTGAVFAEADLRQAAELAVERDLAIICDDTYDYLSYDAPAFSLAQIPEIRDRLIGVGSFSKRYALTGWRVGFFFAPAGLMAEMLKVHDWITCPFCVSVIVENGSTSVRTSASGLPGEINSRGCSTIWITGGFSATPLANNETESTEVRRHRNFFMIFSLKTYSRADGGVSGQVKMNETRPRGAFTARTDPP